MACYRGEWAGGSGWVAGGGLKLSYSNAVSSVSDRKGLNPQDRLRQ